MYDRSFGRNDQKSSDLFKKIKFEIRDSICNLWDRIWKNARMLALFLYIVIQVKKEPSKEEYQQIVKNLTPKHNSLLNCTKAFVTGGTFCALGEVMKQLMMKYLNLSKKDSLLYVTIELILLSVLLTGFNFYGKITKFSGFSCNRISERRTGFWYWR